MSSGLFVLSMSWFAPFEAGFEEKVLWWTTVRGRQEDLYVQVEGGVLLSGIQGLEPLRQILNGINGARWAHLYQELKSLWMLKTRSDTTSQNKPLTKWGKKLKFDVSPCKTSISSPSIENLTFSPLTGFIQLHPILPHESAQGRRGDLLHSGALNNSGFWLPCLCLHISPLPTFFFLPAARTLNF